MQRRHWWDLDASKRKRDKPIMTGTYHVFVHGQIPVVLKETIRGLGRRGQIVHVKRGYARHHLVPKGLAVLGTWENIDEFADPALVADMTLRSKAVVERGRLPFDWVDEISLHFVRWAREDDFGALLEPLTAWDLLEVLSQDHQLDLLPHDLDMPVTGFIQTGKYDVPIQISFKNPEMGTRRYSVFVEIVSQQSLIEEQRREEMAQAVAESSRFTLPRRVGAVDKGEADLEEGLLGE